MGASQKRFIVERQPRVDIGRTLRGDVLEIGPGHAPFPTSSEARVTFADRPVDGGRDATWPELAGQPWGPDADIDLDLDIHGLYAIANEAFDVVIASHVIEHLANPIAALGEFGRVLRPGGRLVLVVPDRTRTFDSVRRPTPLAHVLHDFEEHITEVDADHIREFCQAIYGQPPIHPDEVREWYDPALLDDARLELHRRRSIHVHCWAPEEFAVVIAGILARGLMSWDLVDAYFFDDEGADPDNEFGLVLERPRTHAPSAEQCVAFIRRWSSCVLDVPTRDPGRLFVLQSALISNLEGWKELVPATLTISEELAERMVMARATEESCQRRLSAAESEGEQFATKLETSEQRLAAVQRSRSYRASRILGAPFRPFRRHA